MQKEDDYAVIKSEFEKQKNEWLADLNEKN